MEDVFNVKYNTELDKLEIKKEGMIKKIFKFINKHKFISTMFISLLVFSAINFYLIYSFMKILENV